MLTPKLGHKIILSAFILLVLIFIAGFTYVYVSDSAKPNDQSIQQTAQIRHYKPITPPAANPTEPVGVAVESLDTPIMPGSPTSLIINTNSYAKCTITVQYNGIISKDPALAPKTADAYGILTWTWTVPKNTSVGNWPISVTCRDKNHSGMVEDTLTVQQQ